MLSGIMLSVVMLNVGMLNVLGARKMDSAFSLVRQTRCSTWTNFSQKDKTWAEFSTLEVAICMLRICGFIK
jgi:hypothetical protein